MTWLWFVDLTWGAVFVDPFSDRPELCFVELPWGSVWPVPGPGADMKYKAQAMYQHMGVSEGRLRYVEVSQKEPFILSSFTLDDDGTGWTLEHQVALGQIWPDAGQLEAMPRIAVIDPLKAHTMCVVIGNYAATVDMDLGKVLERVHLGDRGGSNHVCFHHGLNQAPFLLQVISFQMLHVYVLPVQLLYCCTYSN
jgi:hypothetical protein